MSDTRTHIAILVPSLRGGGAERVMLILGRNPAQISNKAKITTIYAMNGS